MNTRLKIENKPIGTFGYRMCCPEHHDLAVLALARNHSLSGLIRGCYGSGATRASRSWE